jgi:hypothetical protein
MSGMTTETLTGRDLDAAVAVIIGPWDDTLPDWDQAKAFVPRFSDASCSGLAPVLAWLRENAPTEAQVAAMGASRDGPAYLQFACRSDGQWWAEYTAVVHYEGPQSVIESELSPTLPAAACRLVVAWAAKKAAL